MKVSIIGGGGLVGSCAAFALQCGGVVSGIDLLDVNADLGRETLCVAVQLHAKFAGRVRAHAISKLFPVNLERSARDFMTRLGHAPPRSHLPQVERRKRNHSGVK